MTDLAKQPAPGPTARARGYRLYVLLMLVLVYAFNFLDRQIIGILAAPIKAEFDLTDSQFGLLGGIAFASVYATLAIPLAWVADRTSRVWVMTGALAVWSGFTALCGAAGNFTQLFLCRMGVGVGEAGGVAPAYSLLADYFPPEQRARALAAFAFGIPVGTAAGTLVGGLLAEAYGWRTAFVVVGVLGVLLAPLLLFTVRDPGRRARAVERATRVEGVSDRLGTRAALLMLSLGGLALVGGLLTRTAGNGGGLTLIFAGLVCAVIGASLAVARRTASYVFRKRSFWLLALGAASSSVCGYGVAGWLPLFFMRSFGLTLAQTSWYYAGIALIGGVLGIWMGGVVADRLGRTSKGGYPLTPAVAFLIAAPCFILAMNSQWLIGQLLPGGGSQAQALTLAFLIFLIPTGLNLAWLGPITAAVQHLAPAAMRSTASALFLLFNNLLGLAVGFYYFGRMADLLKPRFGDESLRWAIYTGMGFYVLAALLFIAASRTLKRDWVEN